MAAWINSRVVTDNRAQGAKMDIIGSRIVLMPAERDLFSNSLTLWFFVIDISSFRASSCRELRMRNGNASSYIRRIMPASETASTTDIDASHL